MINLIDLAKGLQNELNEKAKGMYEFYVVTDTAKFKRPTRNKNDIKEYVNCLLTMNGSDVTTLQTGTLISTATCTLRLIMRLTGYEDDIFSTPDENGKSELITYGDKTRVELMRQYLDAIFQKNTYKQMDDSEDASIKYVVSAVYDFAQSGIRGQVEKIGDSYSFSTTIYYSFVQDGINTRASTFNLDGVLIPFQSVTVFRTPTMDGNVYANTKDGATKNLSSQSVFSISFELPALNDNTTANMLDYLFDGELNKAHFLKLDINGKTKNYLVTYGENKLIGETIMNIGQTLSLVECPEDYDLIYFADNYFIYEASANLNINLGELTVCQFGSSNGFISGVSQVGYGDKIVSLTELTIQGLIKV